MVLRLAWNRVLQQNAPASSIGNLTELERRIPALGPGSLREAPGTERRILASPDRSVGLPQAAMVAGRNFNVSPLR